jgi:hypothetical protein
MATRGRFRRARIFAALSLTLRAPCDTVSAFIGHSAADSGFAQAPPAKPRRPDHTEAHTGPIPAVPLQHDWHRRTPQRMYRCEGTLPSTLDARSRLFVGWRV